MRESFVTDLYGRDLAGIRTSRWQDHMSGAVADGAELRRRVREKVTELCDLGIGVRDVVAIRATTPLSFAVNYLAAAAAGAVVMPLEASLPAEIERIRLTETGARAVLGGDRFRALDTAEVDLPNGVAQILYTGGSTGTPKAVLHTRQGLRDNVRAIAEWTRYSTEDRILATLPLFHCYGITWTVLAPLLTGAEVDNFGRYSTSALRQAGLVPTVWTAVPAAVEMVLRAPSDTGIDWSQLRFCIIGGAPASEDLSARFESLTGRPVLNGYGATEATSFICAPPLTTRSQARGHVGSPVRYMMVRQGTRHGEYHELELGGSMIMAGYLGDPAATAAALTPDGWLRTGDLFEFGNDNDVILRGRLRHVINRGGEKIDPITVASAILRHPDITDCVVFGVPDQTLGEVVACVIESEKPLGLDELRAHLGDHLSPYAMPTLLAVTAHLPRNAVGKVNPAIARDLITRAV